MFEFGRYTLSYQPPEGAVEADVSMSISSEADLDQMLRFFESFLQASGYIIDGKELSLLSAVPEIDEFSGLVNSLWINGENILAKGK
jgi:hypothetical protein